MSFQKVRIDQWCPVPADSEQAVRDYVETDPTVISHAIHTANWTSKCTLAANAQAFKKAIEDSGGAATLIDC